MAIDNLGWFLYVVVVDTIDPQRPDVTRLLKVFI